MIGSPFDLPSASRARRDLWRPTLFGAVLAIATTLTASVTLLLARPPKDASAYSQAYNCETFVGQPTCHLTAGSWHNLTNVGAHNYNAAGDICAQYGTLSSTLQCSSSYQILLCDYTSPVYEYGIAETVSGNDNISGHEDDSNTCS
jgi:hypothetical protein